MTGKRFIGILRVPLETEIIPYSDETIDDVITTCNCRLVWSCNYRLDNVVLSHLSISRRWHRHCSKVGRIR